MILISKARTPYMPVTRYSSYFFTPYSQHKNIYISFLHKGKRQDIKKARHKNCYRQR